MGTSSTVVLEKNMKEAAYGHKTDAVRGNTQWEHEIFPFCNSVVWVILYKFMFNNHTIEP